ncbi:germin-like protein 9-3 [Elaeis guineensis]|uniref:Germin-like protein n=1 Tax=Elaeis guineensis var. tenera TaxID=51953 RepID=A0A6I9SIN4_ELAGV|nr:germin-like protein 9-3 [Elaeis guineensis]
MPNTTPHPIASKHCKLGTMALNALSHVLFFLLLAFAMSHVAFAGDPDITSDFVLPPNTTAVDGSFFTFTGMRKAITPDPPKAFTVLKATMAEFPALNGQSVSFATLMFPAGSINPPHTHPRAAELLFLVEGLLEVGFVDATNKLFTQRLQPGDMFVFPKGLVHYQHCFGQSPAAAISAFGSASAGTVSVSGSVFTSGIDDGILAKSFKTDVATIRMIKSGLAPKA